MLSTRLHVTPYERRHRGTLLDLTWTSLWTHKHLDWYKISDWIDRDDVHIILAWEGEQLVGYLGLSSPQDSSSWIRLLGIRNGAMPDAIISELWRHAVSFCHHHSIASVYIMMSNNWCGKYLVPLGFDYWDELVTFTLIKRLAERAPPPAIAVLSAELEHIPSIAQIDRLAFSPPWRMSERDLRQACRLAAHPTVARRAGEMVGYQISTRHQDVAHLARLAVTPSLQGRRIGAALLSHLIDSLDRRGIQTLSVNTQLSNLPSQRLYARFGFVRSGFDIEVWRARLR